MMKKKTIFILSPIPWKSHNVQIQLWAKQLSRQYRVIYLDTFSGKKTTLWWLFSKKNYKTVVSFYKQLFFSGKSLISHPILLTFREYNSGETLRKIDQILYFFQILCWSFLLEERKVVIAYTTFFPPILKNLPFQWIFDFFDRIFFNNSPQIEKVVRINEDWLLTHSSVVFYASSFYKNFIDKATKKLRLPIHAQFCPLGYSLPKKQYMNKQWLKVLKKKKIVIGFSGGISDRIDFALVMRIITACPNYTFSFIGPTFVESWFSYPKVGLNEFMQFLRSAKNVEIHREIRDRDKLFLFMSSFTIGWIPYTPELGFNIYSHPTKFVEYASIGLPIVTTRLPTLSETSYDRWRYFYSDLSSFKQAVSLALKKHNRDIQSEEMRFASMQSKAKITAIEKAIVEYEW